MSVRDCGKGKRPRGCLEMRNFKVFLPEWPLKLDGTIVRTVFDGAHKFVNRSLDHESIFTFCIGLDLAPMRSTATTIAKHSSLFSHFRHGPDCPPANKWIPVSSQVDPIDLLFSFLFVQDVSRPSLSLFCSNFERRKLFEKPRREKV